MPFCKYRVSDNCDKHHTKCFSSESSCPEFEPEEKTYADRIRAMSDEKLAEFLCEIRYLNSQPDYNDMIEWLKMKSSPKN